MEGNLSNKNEHTHTNEHTFLHLPHSWKKLQNVKTEAFWTIISALQNDGVAYPLLSFKLIHFPAISSAATSVPPPFLLFPLLARSSRSSGCSGGN